MRKRLLVLCMIALLLCAAVPSVSAAAPVSGLIVGTGQASPEVSELWSEIDVPLRVEQNPGAAAFSIDVAFDAAVLEYLSCDDADAELGTILTAGSAGGQDGVVRLVGAFGDFTEDSNETGLLAVLKFRAVGAGTAEVTVDAENSYALRTDDTPVTFVAAPPTSVTVAEGGTTLTAGSVANVGAGWLITVPVQIAANPGVAGYVIDVAYDDTYLEFVRCGNGDMIENLLAGGPYADAAEPTIRVVGAQGPDAPGSGTLCSLYFTVKDGAGGESAVRIAETSALMNAAGSAVSYTAAAGTVSTEGQTGEAGQSSSLGTVAIVGICAGAAAIIAAIIALIFHRKKQTSDSAS